MFNKLAPAGAGNCINLHAKLVCLNPKLVWLRELSACKGLEQGINTKIHGKQNNVVLLSVSKNVACGKTN